jgi:hypothetical protein
VSDVPTPEQKRGRPSLPLADMIFAASFKVYSTVSARRFMTDLRSTATDLGMIDRTPHYNSIFNLLDRQTLTPMFHELITRSALPLKSLETQFAVDSTGFGTQQFYRHYSAKYGHEQYSRDYLKLHAVVGTKTTVIAAAHVSDRDTHDSPILAGLVTEAVQHFGVNEVSADKGYAGHANIEGIASIGATLYSRSRRTPRATANRCSGTSVPFLPDEPNPRSPRCNGSSVASSGARHPPLSETNCC